MVLKKIKFFWSFWFENQSLTLEWTTVFLFVFWVPVTYSVYFFFFFLNSFNAVSHTTWFNSWILPPAACISSGALSPGTRLGMVTFKSFYRVVILEPPLIAILHKSFASLFFVSCFLGFLPLTMPSFYGIFLGHCPRECKYLPSCNHKGYKSLKVKERMMEGAWSIDACTPTMKWTTL